MIIIATIADVLELFEKLSPAEQEEIKLILASPFVGSTTLEEFLTSERFANGRVCPHCGSIHAVRNGHVKEKQRYLCRDCERSFVISTNSIISGSTKDLNTWEKYIECMIQGLSLRKSAQICNISKNTAFNWRHKVLDTLQIMADSVELDGIVEADETFFSVSYKGNHSKSSFAMPRAAHHRGGEDTKRGLSSQKVCVSCAVNRTGKSIAKATNFGRVSTDDLKSAFDGRIDKSATLIADKMNAYVKFAEDNGLELVQIKGGKTVKGIYHIQHINNYHSQLKGFLYPFKGVSTKYLNNYLVWHNFVNYAKKTDIEKLKILLAFVLVAQKKEKISEISKRNSVPF